MNNQQGKTATSFGKTQFAEFNLDECKTRVKEEEKKQEEIDQNLQEFQKKIKEKKQMIGGVNAGMENQTMLNKQIKILENRLDKANQKFNEAIAINRNLRQTIDSLRRERVIFDNLYKKLEKELHEKRKAMANIIEDANSAYEERDKANDQIQNLKHQAKRESLDFEKELRELSQIMEKNKRTMEYIKMTEKNKEETALQMDKAENEKLAKTKVQKMLKEKNISQSMIEKIQKYEEDFAKIQAATQIKDFEQLITIFIKNEEKNFNMFKYLNELSNEIEDLEKTIQELKDEKRKYEGHGSNIDVQRKNKLKEFEEKLTRAESKADSNELKYNNSNKLISSLTNWIDTLFETIECDKELVKELAGTHYTTDSNMMIFLGLIEDKVNQVLDFYSKILQQKGSENLHSLLMNTSQFNQTLLSTGQARGKLDLPGFNDENDDDDQEGIKPLTMEEFRLKALEQLEVPLSFNSQNKKQQGVRKQFKQAQKGRKPK